MLAARWPTPFAAVRHAAAPAKLRSRVPHLPSSSSPLRSHVLGRTVCTTTTATRTAHSTNFLYSYRLAIALALPAGALTLGALGGSAPHKPVLECASAERAYATAPAPTRALSRLSGAVIKGETDRMQTTFAVSPDEAELTEAESIVNIRDLSFGTVSGICVGVFVKKGLRVRGDRKHIPLTVAPEKDSDIQSLFARTATSTGTRFRSRRRLCSPSGESHLSPSSRQKLSS